MVERPYCEEPLDHHHSAFKDSLYEMDSREQQLQIIRGLLLRTRENDGYDQEIAYLLVCNGIPCGLPCDIKWELIALELVNMDDHGHLSFMTELYDLWGIERDRLNPRMNLPDSALGLQLQRYRQK